MRSVVPKRGRCYHARWTSRAVGPAGGIREEHVMPDQKQNPNTKQDQNKAPEPLKTSVTVTEKISAETPANISVLDRTSLEQSPGTNLDDRLRDVPASASSGDRRA